MPNKTTIKQIRSQVIIKMIFKNIEPCILLQVIKYNKKLQKYLGYDIKDYMDFKTVNSPIELEIIPPESAFGKFINNIIYGEEKCFRIYFNRICMQVELILLSLKWKF